MEIRSGYAHHPTKDVDVELHYEDLGDEADPAVLLIMGLGAQLTLWHNEFCGKLVDRGYRVIRFDNRDVGLSSKLHGRKVDGGLVPGLLRSFVGLPSTSVYRLEDMAADAAAVLDHLGIDRAHIVGASMGGMIAQVFAATYPQRTAGLGIIFSSNNAALLPPPAPKALLSAVYEGAMVDFDTALRIEARWFTSVVLNPVSGEDLYGTVVHLDRKTDGDLTLAVTEDLPHSVIETDHIGRDVELFDCRIE